MKNRVQLFKENPMLGGYTLAVRDDWVYKIKYIHISEKEKAEYEKVFGNELITYDRFFDWWCRLNRTGKYADKI